MDQRPDGHDGQEDQARRQREDGAQIAKQRVFCDAPAVQEKQRRDKHQEEHVWGQPYIELGQCRQNRSTDDLN